ncbi:hypothetical protein HF263_18455 [Rhizobium leguminosarum]|nr:hypothetical protein [Rhizobium leguminosarum]
MIAEHIEEIFHEFLLVRLVAADFPAFAEFTYGKRVNKAFKGTEKATNLLQTHSGKRHWI